MALERTLLLIAWTLYLLAIFALADVALVLALLATRGEDGITSTSLVLILMSAVFSLVYVALHLHFAVQFQRSSQRGRRRTRLESIARFIPRLLILFWIGASANGLLVAARQPRCLSASISPDLWRAGPSCKLHRSATGLAVGALIATCVLFCCTEVSDRPFHASLFRAERPRQDSSFGLTPSPSELSCSPSPGSSLDLCECEKTDDGTVLTRQLSARAFWLQRQNSLSSRNAVYPPCLRQPSGFPRPAYGSLRATSAPQVGTPRYQPCWPSYRSLRSTSTSSSASAGISLPSVLEHEASHMSYSTSPGRAPSSVSSSSSSPLSTMRRVSQPDVPIIPNRFQSVSSSSQASSQPRRRSSLPYAWSPLLHYTPLSADPAIRALSIHSESVDVSEDPFIDSGSVICSVEPALSAGRKLSLLGLNRPELPKRARGHVLEASGNSV